LDQQSTRLVIGQTDNLLMFTSVNCFNPQCSLPTNPIDALTCQSCGSGLFLKSRYQAVRRLGRGGWIKTFLTLDRKQTPPRLCVTQYLPSTAKTDSQSIHKASNDNTPFHAAPGFIAPELQILQTLGQHPQLPTLIDCFADQGGVYLVQSYQPGTSLAERLATDGCLSAAEIWQVLEGLLPVLQWLQTQNVIHGDIKPGNLIAGDRWISLVDFSTAKFLSLPRIIWEPGLGSPEYAAPEQLQGQPTFASDLYSLGVTCIHLLTGLSPFNLREFADGAWSWRHYWQPESADSEQDIHLADSLDLLIQRQLSQRLPSATAAIAHIQRLRGKPMKVEKKTKKPPESLPWRCYATLVGHQGLFAGVNAVAIAHSCTKMASASDDHTIRLWNLQTGEAAQILCGHTHFVKSVAFHPHDPNRLASGSRDRTLKLWDVQEQQEIYTLTGHLNTVNAVSFSPNGEILASGSADKTVKLWNPKTGERLATLTGAKLAVNAIAFSPVTSLIAGASTDCRVLVWDISSQTLVQTLAGHTAAVHEIAFSADGSYLATAGEDRCIRLWETQTWSCKQILPGHSWAISALVFSPDGQYLLSGSWDKTIKCWRLKEDGDSASQPITVEQTTLVTGHTDAVSCLAIAKLFFDRTEEKTEREILVSGSLDQTAKLWHQDLYLP
jgi:WD40 repeat protein